MLAREKASEPGEEKRIRRRAKRRQEARTKRVSLSFLFSLFSSLSSVSCFPATYRRRPGPGAPASGPRRFLASPARSRRGGRSRPGALLEVEEAAEAVAWTTTKRRSSWLKQQQQRSTTIMTIETRASSVASRKARLIPLWDGRTRWATLAAGRRGLRRRGARTSRVD